jgi:hypothetical protein
VPWDGGPLPLGETDLTAVYTFRSPRDPTRHAALAVDGTRATAYVELDPKALGLLIETIRTSGNQTAALAPDADTKQSLSPHIKVEPKLPPPTKFGYEAQFASKAARDERALILKTLDDSMACQADPGGEICRPEPPQPVRWNGEPLPPFKTELGAVYIYDSPFDPDSLLAISVDADQVTSWVELDRQSLSTLVATLHAPGTEATAPVLTVFPPGTTPPPKGQEATFAIALAHRERELITRIAAEIESGQLCGN